MLNYFMARHKHDDDDDWDEDYDPSWDNDFDEAFLTIVNFRDYINCHK